MGKKGDKLFPVIDPKTINKTVRDRLREAILTGAFKPGERLIQHDIARRLGVSRIPVREALQRLEGEGLVKILPYKGAVVAEFTMRDVREIFFLRGLLEGAATRLAAPRMTFQVIDSLKSLLTEMERLIGHDPDIETLADINARFHEAIYKHANSPRLYSMIQSLWMSFPKSSLLFPLDRVHVSLREHKEIVDALSIGDAQRAELLMRLHVDSVAEDEIEWVEHFRLDGSDTVNGGDGTKDGTRIVGRRHNV